jgi:hypothetical protein
LSVVLAYAGGEAVSDSAETLQGLSIGMLLSYLAFYLGLALFFLWFGGRWFLGNKLLTKSCVAVFIVAAILITFGYGFILVSSMDMIAFKSEAVTYAETIAYEIPLTLKAGQYAFSVVAMAEDPIRIAVKQGDNYLVSTEYNTSAQLAQPLTLEEGSYTIVVLSEEGRTLDGGTLTVSVSVMRIALS